MALNTVFAQNSGNVGGGNSTDGNVGNGDFATPADVPDGVIAFFPLNGGRSIDLSSNSLSDFDKLVAVLGTPVDQVPRRTNILEPADITVTSLGFAAPQTQVTEVTPYTVSSESSVGVKVSGQVGNQPEPRRTASFVADSSMTQVDLINELISQINSWEDPINAGADGVTGDMNVFAGSDLEIEVTPSSGAASGQAQVSIDGDSYDITWDTDKATTSQAFVDAHAAEIRSTHGIDVTVDGSDNLEFAYVETALTASDLTVSDGSATALAKSTQTAKSALRIKADTAQDIFDIALTGELDGEVLQITDPQPGSGTGHQVSEMEESVFGILGRNLVDTGILGEQDDPRVFADTSLNYDLITIRQETDYDQSINPSNRYQDIKLAVETSIDSSPVNNFLGTSL